MFIKSVNYRKGSRTNATVRPGSPTRATVPHMDSGQIDLDRLRAIITDEDAGAWVVAVAGPLVAGSADLWRAKIIIGSGEEPSDLRVWAYESCTFVSTRLRASALTVVIACRSVCCLLYTSNRARSPAEQLPANSTLARPSCEKGPCL